MSWREIITPDFTTKLKRDKNCNSYPILSIFTLTPRFCTTVGSSGVRWRHNYVFWDRYVPSFYTYRAPLLALQYNYTAVKDTHQVREENTENLAFIFFLFLSYSHQLAASHGSLATAIVLRHHTILIFAALNFLIILFLKLRKNSMLLSKRRNRERQNGSREQNRKWIIGLRFKFAFVFLFHFLAPVLVSRSPL